MRARNFLQLDINATSTRIGLSHPRLFTPRLLTNMPSSATMDAKRVYGPGYVEGKTNYDVGNTQSRAIRSIILTGTTCGPNPAQRRIRTTPHHWTGRHGQSLFSGACFPQHPARHQASTSGRTTTGKRDRRARDTATRTPP